MTEDLLKTAKALKLELDIFKQIKLLLEKNKNDLANQSILAGITNNIVYASGILCSKILNPSLVLRQTALELAIKEIGKKEETGNNDGQDIRRYQEYTSWLENKPWCCSLVSYCYKEAAKQIGVERPFPHEASVNRFVELAKKNNWIIPKSEMKEGDLFVQLGETADGSHIGFIKELQLPLIVTVEGNFGNGVKSRPMNSNLISLVIRVKI